MSVAASIPCIRLPSSSPSCSSSPSSSALRFSACNKASSLSILIIRSSQAEGPLRRPVVPSVREPTPPNPPAVKPPSPPTSQPPASAAALEDLKGTVTMEYQRQKAKELQQYFKQKKLEEASQGPAFGFLTKNEINNGRWAMFGFAVGLLTEYATGSNFVDQMKILLSNFGIVDLE